MEPMGIRWIVLAILTFASFVSYVLKYNVSIVSESMMHAFHMNEYQLGMVFSAYAAAYAIFQIPGGIFGDRFGPRFTITAIAVAWTLLTVLTAVIPGPEALPVAAIVAALVVTRFLVGAVHAPFFPVIIGGSIASWFPVRQWGIANGLTSTGLTLGAAATGPIVVWLMQTYGWRGAVLISAPTGLAVAALYYWYVQDDPGEHPRISASELEVIRSDRPPDSGIEKGAWKHALKNRNVLLLTVGYFCMNYVFYLFFNWFFFYLVNVKQFPAAQAGMVTASQWILGAVGATVGGFVCDMLVRRSGIRLGPKYLAITALMLSGIFLYVGAMSDNVGITVIMLCTSFACNQLTEAPFWVATMAVAGHHGPVATGVLNTGGNLTGIVGGLMVPVTASLFGWPAAIATGSLFAVTGAVLWLFVRADEPMGA
jgi:MFS transporter, ACS family, glucarate transporter